jgi:RNA polymerase sigma-70 factor, ECF subfamily
VQNKRAKFNEILKEYRWPVYRQAFRRLHDASAAEEVTQDVLISVLRDLENFREESQLRTWIYRITAHKCIARQRKVVVKSIPLEEAEAEKPLVNEEINPEHLYLKHEANARLDGFIGQLPNNEATAITLCYYEDKSYGDIARILRIPQGTVATLIHRGRLHLHKLLIDPDLKEE